MKGFIASILGTLWDHQILRWILIIGTIILIIALYTGIDTAQKMLQNSTLLK